MKIGLLATGTELVTGDILNTNGQYIAHSLNDHGYAIGLHLIVSDETTAIENALTFLLDEHQVVIMTGGLGPTTDDLTRFALAGVTQQPLVHSDASWNRIIERFKHYGLTLLENNRQQSLFPRDATIYPNLNGTADGCKLIYKDKIIYMLPGPPNECLPLFENYVLTDIKQHFTQDNFYKRKWRLFNVSESEIANKLEAILGNTNVTTGYRIDYPYLEFKIIAPEKPTLWLEEIEALIQPYLLADAYQPASVVLQQQLTTLPAPLLIIDTATGGTLYMALVNRDNYTKLVYTQKSGLGLNEQDFFAVIEVQGLSEYWLKDEQASTTSVTLTLRQHNQEQTLEITIPYRPIRVVKYATEIIANHILKWLF